MNYFAGNTAIAERQIFTEKQWTKLVEMLGLSPRQEEVARCVFRGFTDKQIASQLEIGIPTVRNHFWRMFRKLDVQDRNELILHIVDTFLTGCRNNGCHRM